MLLCIVMHDVDEVERAIHFVTVVDVAWIVCIDDGYVVDAAVGAVDCIALFIFTIAASSSISRPHIVAVDGRRQ